MHSPVDVSHVPPMSERHSLEHVITGVVGVGASVGTSVGASVGASVGGTDSVGGGVVGGGTVQSHPEYPPAQMQVPVNVSHVPAHEGAHWMLVAERHAVAGSGHWRLLL